MTVLRAFGRGLGQTFRHWRLVLPLYVANLIVSLLATIPVWLWLRGTIGHHTWAAMLAGNPLALLIEFQGAASARPPGGELNWLPPALALALPLLVLNSLAYAWLCGGVLEVLTAGPTMTPGTFWDDCRLWFWPFTRLWLISIAALVVAAVIAFLFSGIGPWAANQFIVFALLVPVVVLGTNGVFEYARIGAVLRRDRGMLRATARGYGFALRYLPAALALGILLLGAAALVAGFDFGTGRLIPGSIAVLGLLWGQVAAFAAAGVKVFRLASQASLYEQKTGGLRR